MKKSKRLARLLLLIVGSVSIAGLSVAPAAAQTVLQAYNASTSLQVGLIVRLGSKNTVTPVSSDQASNMFGVVVSPSQVNETITSGNSNAPQIYVATSGTYNVLVSDQDGPIAAGSFVTISSVDGVAMAAGTANTTVFGRAAAAFKGKSDSIGTESLKTSSGQSTVNLGLIPVAIQIEHNPDHKSTQVNLPKFLQRVGQEIAEKPIGAMRTYLSVAITVLSVIIAIVVLYSGIRNSIIAIGRNPLSKKSIFRSLLEIILTSFIILTIGLFAVYLILKL